MSERDRRPLHDLRGNLNGLALQLEVMALAFSRGDRAMHERALSAARDAMTRASEQLEALRDDGAA